VPEWKRGDCWRRIRQLRRTPALVNENAAQGAGKANTGASRRAGSRPWTAEDDATLLDLAGYEPVNRIAERLNRSERSVRFRLGALGMSARVKDGWSQRGLRKLLRVSRARLRQLVASGMLRVRDPRITAKSLTAWRMKNRAAANPTSSRAIPSETASAEGPYSWKRAAKLLNVELPEVQVLISDGHLKLVDTFVTDRAFEEFCKKHGSAINMALIDTSTRRWLVCEYGVPGHVENKELPRAQKHALVIRQCKCGRRIAGNVYFRHVRRCPSFRRCPLPQSDDGQGYPRDGI